MKIKGFKPLDAYEKKLMEAIKKDEFVSVPNKEAEIERLTSYFKQLPRKDTRITIRVNEDDLQKIQAKAVKSGLPYQSLISSLLHRFAKGDVKIGI